MNTFGLRMAKTLYFAWQAEGLCLTTEPQAVPELKGDLMERELEELLIVTSSDRTRTAMGLRGRGMLSKFSNDFLYEQ